uniref:hypothetical protein n=1 Tax=Curtobacterium sp. ME12 TaxID=2744253 RepID=UPI001C712449
KGNLDRHDCEQPVAGDWRRAEQLLLPLDVHGWARTGVSLSGRSMTSIIPSRRAAAAGDRIVETLGALSRRPSRFDALTLQETYAELGSTDDAVDDALTRLATILNDAQALGADLQQAATTPRKQQIAADSDH